MDEKNQSLEIISFRLDAIENEIKSLKDLLISVPLLVSKLDDFKNETKEDLENLNKKIDVSNKNIEDKFNQKIIDDINRIEAKMEANENALRLEARSRMEAAEKRLDAIEVNYDLLLKELSSLKSEMSVIKNAPDKKAAGKMNYIADYIFKALVGICVSYIIFKIGLGNIGG